MAQVPKLVPVSELRQDAAAILDQVKNSVEPVFITQRGRATAVLLGIDSYSRSMQTHELLVRLAQGEQDIAAGRVSSMDEVMNDLDDLLQDDHAD